MGITESATIWISRAPIWQHFGNPGRFTWSVRISKRTPTTPPYRVRVTKMTLSTSSLCREVTSVVDRAYASSRPEVELRLSNLRIVGNVKRFVVSRMGSTGSGWLAKLLDAHRSEEHTSELQSLRH